MSDQIVLPAAIAHRGFYGDLSKLMHGTNDEALLYVMEAAGLFKVGITRDMEKRLKSIRAQCPVPVSLVVSYPVAIDVAGWAEYVAHVALSPHHDHDEWFHCTKYQAREVCRISAMRANSIPDGWWRDRKRHPRDFTPPYVHTSKLMKVADTFFYPHLPSKIREKQRPDSSTAAP